MKTDFPDKISYRLLLDVLSFKIRHGSIEESDDTTELVMELLYLEHQGNLMLAEQKASRFEQI